MRTSPAVTDFVRRALGISGTASKADWQRLLAFADRFQLTLFLDAEQAPAFVLDEIEMRAGKNRERLARLMEAHTEVASALSRAGVDYTVLKGLTHSELGGNRVRRVQYDIDLLCSPGEAQAAVRALRSVGYLPHALMSLSDQHLPPLVKRRDWVWTGDYYDPDLPIPVEIHTSLWNEERDRLRLYDVARFPQRRTSVDIGGLAVPALSAPDRLAFACLHAIRHILRDDARPAHVFEIGIMAEALAERDNFWSEWAVLQGEKLRATQAIAFRFAEEWFGARVPAGPAREIACLPRRVTAWFEVFAWSPVRNLVGPAPNKDVIWLHYAMLETTRDRMSMLRRRLVPLRSPVAGPAAARARHHASAVAPALLSGFSWWRRATASSTAAHTAV